MGTSESMCVASAVPALHELWRNPDPAALLALRPCATGSSRRAEASMAAALDVVHTLMDPDALALPDLVRSIGVWRPRDCLATDLLAGSLLAEAISGDEAARIAITHLRRQRCLEDFDWPRPVQAFARDDFGDGDQTAELTALSP
jgi:hypothetical protein